MCKYSVHYSKYFTVLKIMHFFNIAISLRPFSIIWVWYRCATSVSQLQGFSSFFVPEKKPNLAHWICLQLKPYVPLIWSTNYFCIYISVKNVKFSYLKILLYWKKSFVMVENNTTFITSLSQRKRSNYLYEIRSKNEV